MVQSGPVQIFKMKLVYKIVELLNNFNFSTSIRNSLWTIILVIESKIFASITSYQYEVQDSQCNIVANQPRTNSMNV